MGNGNCGCTVPADNPEATNISGEDMSVTEWRREAQDSSRSRSREQDQEVGVKPEVADGVQAHTPCDWKPALASLEEEDDKGDLSSIQISVLDEARVTERFAELSPITEKVVQERSRQVVDDAKKQWEKESQEFHRSDRANRWQADLDQTRKLMREDTALTRMPGNRYGPEATLPHFERGRHVPLLGLINPMSGAMAGMDILGVCKHTAYYQERIFNIIDVIKGQRKGGMLDVFRIELIKAKEEARAMNERPRLISGGGDGTGSFALFIVFLALKADSERSEDGLADTGNGFIWTDQEMSESFPALAQMPLGSANDFANILGWGQKYPGNEGTSKKAAASLARWFEAVIDPASQVVNFDLWGILPPEGKDTCDFKLGELTGMRGQCPNKQVDGKRQVHLKEAGKPVPLFVCLYFSAGFGAYMTARFQINRHGTPIHNRLEYIRQAKNIMLERTPPQLQLRLNGVTIDCEGSPYFPPRRDKGNRGRGYREVGFYNINWQAHALHGADRQVLRKRCACGSSASRRPVTFNDGQMDMFRWKLTSFLKNPGLRVQTDKKKDMLLRYEGRCGQGVFFQWDGEARFAFSPDGQPFHIFIRKVCNIPVVIGPYHSRSLTGELDNGERVRFELCGDTPEERERVRKRILQGVRGELDAELNASREELNAAKFPGGYGADPADPAATEKTNLVQAEIATGGSA